MKKSTFYLICSLLMLSNLISAQYYYRYNYTYNNLSINDPQRTYNYYCEGAISEASLNIKPHGSYLEYDLYLTLRAEPRQYPDYYGYPKSVPTDVQLESVLQFSLPENSFITDSWLWVGDSIMRALLLDKWTARSIYEGIVNRRKDPSILYKVSANQYQLSVYPINPKLSRKLKISYMVPFNFGQEYITAPLPLNILKTSDTIPDLKVTVFPLNTNLTPVIFEYSDLTFTKTNGTFTTIIPSSKLKAASLMNVALPNPASHTIFFNTVTVNNEGYYQMVFTPADLLSVGKHRKVAVVLDCEPYIMQHYSYYDYYSNIYTPVKQPVDIDQMLSSVKYALFSQMSPQDSFTIFYNSLGTVKGTSASWAPATPGEIESSMISVKMGITQTSLLSSTLPAAVNFINKYDSTGSILIVGNSDEYCKSIDTSKNIIKKVLALMRPGNIPVSVIDCSNSWYGFSDNGTYYYGNDYLYTNITRTTQGNRLSARQSGESLSSMLIKGLQQIDGKMQLFDYHLSMSSGFCYSRFGNDATNYSINKPIVEYGKFEGAPPFILEVNARIDSQLFNIKMSIDKGIIDFSPIKTNKIWAGNYIQSLENSFNSSDDIAQIIKASLDNRVLCSYTAFLALEPNDSIHACQDCNENSMGEMIIETDARGNSNYSTMSLDDVKADSTVDAGVYPNPFTEKTTVGISLKDFTTLLTVDVYNMQGVLVKNIYTSKNIAPQTLSLDWTGDDASGNPVDPGVYLIYIKTANGKSVKKVIKY